MAGNSPAAQVQDLTSRKKALFDMYEDSKKGFPDVRKLHLGKHDTVLCLSVYDISYAWQVQAISCNELQGMLSSNEPIVLVDVRSPDEQSVSILPGHVVKKEDFDRHPHDYSDSKIVTYWYAFHCNMASIANGIAHTHPTSVSCNCDMQLQGHSTCCVSAAPLGSEVVSMLRS